MSSLSCLGQAYAGLKTGLRGLFNLKSMALSVSLSLSGALALPMMDAPSARTGGGERLSAFDPAAHGVRHDALKVAADGTIVIDGFSGMDVYKEGLSGGNLYAGPKTVQINTHGGGAGPWYSLHSDGEADASISTAEISAILTRINPETVIVVGCNRDGAGPAEVEALIRRQDRALTTVIMTAPGYYSICVPDMFIGSYDNPLGRTVCGIGNDQGLSCLILRARDYFKGEDSTLGPLIRYERTCGTGPEDAPGGSWQDKGAFRGDNRFDLVDPLPVGWLRDAWRTAVRGPGAVCAELDRINDPGNTLTYWQKVSRNLEKPLVAPFHALHKAGRWLCGYAP